MKSNFILYSSAVRDSPNADEALSLLSMPQPPTKKVIEEACSRLLEFGVGSKGKGHVIIRSGALGAYVATRDKPGFWVDAYWADADIGKVVDVTGTPDLLYIQL